MMILRALRRQNTNEIHSVLLLVAALWLSIVSLSEGGTPSLFQPERRRMKRLGLLTATIPWAFGPYQSQMHALSLLLSKPSNDTISYDTHWISFVSQVAMPAGPYSSWDEMQPHLPLVDPPPDDFPLDHLTFIGMDHQRTSGETMYASDLNELASQHGLDAFLFLFDIGKVVPDVDYDVPVVSWVPLHSDKVQKSRPDYWILKSYHGVAALSPSAERAIDDAVGLAATPENDFSPTLRELFGTTQVKFVPHIIDRHSLEEQASIGMRLLQSVSAREADRRLGGGEEMTGGEPDYLFSSDVLKDGSFVVLMQGGNYDSDDRKGWDTAIQAFSRFYKTTFDSDEQSLDGSVKHRAHLFLHPIESYLVAAEMNRGDEAPPDVLPQGLNLHRALHDSGLPREAYTIDIAKHQPEVVAAYKKRADVCLHASKVEGFGMNVLECQALETPVITTNYTAMGDFTRLGISVSPRQTINTPGGVYEMALPDVEGVAEALGALYKEHALIQRNAVSASPDQDAREAADKRKLDLALTREWIDETFSPDRVLDSMKALLNMTAEEFRVREKARLTMQQSPPPVAGAFEIAKGDHSTTVDWEAPWTLLAPPGLVLPAPQQINALCWSLLIKEQTPGPVLVLPAVYSHSKVDVPYVDQQGYPHKDLPILVRTYMVASLQGQISRRRSLVTLALRAARNGPLRLPDGLALIDNENTDMEEPYSTMRREL